MLMLWITFQPASILFCMPASVRIMNKIPKYQQAGVSLWRAFLFLGCFRESADPLKGLMDLEGGWISWFCGVALEWAPCTIPWGSQLSLCSA